jgi:hypothetical protein
MKILIREEADCSNNNNEYYEQYYAESSYALAFFVCT